MDEVYRERTRQMLRQIKEHMDKEWLKRKAKGTLLKGKIILPNAEKPKRKRKRKRKRRIRSFKLIRGKRRGDQIVFKQIGIVKRKNRKYKIKNGRYFKRSNR